MIASTSGKSAQDGYLVTVGHLLAVLRGRWRSFAVTVLALLLTALVVSLLMPKRYTATATVLVDIRSPDPISGTLIQGLMSPSYMNTQVDLLKNDAVARRAVDSLGLLQDAKLMQRWREANTGTRDAAGWAAAYIVRNLKVEPAKDSNLLEVSYVADDPAFAARAANAFVQAYLDTSLALRQEPAKRHKQFFDASATRLRRELDAAQARLSAYEKAKGIMADDRQIDVESARLLELSNQLVTLQSQAAETRIRHEQGASNSELLQDSLASPVIISLRTDLQRNREWLTGMLAIRGDNHPTVIEMRERVAELERRIAEEARRVSGGVAMTGRVNQQRLGDLRAALERQRERVALLKSARDEAVSLRRDVENAQKAYDAVAGRGTQMSLESQLDQSNISVVGWALEPIQHSSPKLVLNMTGAMVLGVLAGLCLALWREAHDRRIRLEEEFSMLVQQPLLVTLPRFNVNRASAPGLSLALTSLKRLTRT